MATYKTLLMDAIEAIPEFKASYDEAIERDVIDYDSGAHTVFSLVFMPIYIDAIKNNSALADKISAFVEDMEKSKDPYVAEVAEFTVLEELCDEFDDKDISIYIYPETAKALKNIRGYITG